MFDIAQLACRVGGGECGTKPPKSYHNTWLRDRGRVKGFVHSPLDRAPYGTVRNSIGLPVTTFVTGNSTEAFQAGLGSLPP